MIGCKVNSGPFDRDFNNPRHSARSPATELALPTSTPNWVLWTAAFGALVSSASASLVGAGVTSGIGLAVTVLAGLLGGSISVPAAGSGGAIIDLDATSGEAGVAEAGFAVF
jgi:hypothetical protein